MKKQHVYPILLATLLGLAISACNRAETDSDAGSTGNTTGVTDTEIVIGSWGPLTGPAALWGSTVKGTDAYFKMINEQGGINGRQIKFVFKDDGYDPSKTVPAVRELVQKDEIFALAGGIGTAGCMAVMGFLEENNVPWISPMTGASHWTFPTKKNIFTIFPLYFDEAQALTKLAINDLGTKKLGIVYVNDDFGKSGLVGARSILTENGLDFVAALPMETTDTDLSSHVAKLKESGAEAVIVWVLPRQAAILLGSSAVIDFQPKWLAPSVLSDMTLMYDITKGAWEGVYFASFTDVMHNDENHKTMMKYKAAYAKYYPEERWGAFAAAGFLLVEPLIEGLKRAGKDLTREALLDALAGMHNFMNSSGIPISFSEENHLGNRTLAIMRCKSATEAESVSELMTGNSNVEELIQKLMEN